MLKTADRRVPRHSTRHGGLGAHHAVASEPASLLGAPDRSHWTLAWGEEGGRAVEGGATTTVAGGTGAPSFVPVITKLSFHWRDPGNCMLRFLSHKNLKNLCCVF